MGLGPVGRLARLVVTQYWLTCSMVVGVELPGPRDPALDLVEYQHQVVLVAGGTQP